MSYLPVDQYLPPNEWFDCWWEPNQFLKAVLRHNRRVPGCIFFNRPKCKPLREAYAAALFSTILAQNGRSVKVKLVSDRFPDFQLRVDDRTCPFEFELGEAYPPGYRRGDEYKKAKSQIKRVNLEGERKILRAIEKILKAKAEKHYSQKPHLLIYVNFFLFDRPSPECLRKVYRLGKRFCGSFQEIWLLWGANAIQCWPAARLFPAHTLPPLFQ